MQALRLALRLAQGQARVLGVQAGPRSPALQEPQPVVVGRVRAWSLSLAQQGRLSVRPTPLAQLARSAAGQRAAAALGLTPVWMVVLVA